MSSLEGIQRQGYAEAEGAGLIRPVRSDLDEAYVERVAALSVSADRDLKIVYTPLHGVGATSVSPVLRKAGFTDVAEVQSQSVPDGSFPTVAGGAANPEVPGALALAIQDAAANGADLVLASDPDADRLGCAVPHPESGWDAEPEALCLNGNQIGVILCHYLLSRMKEAGTLPPGGVVAKTIVTTDLTSRIAHAFGVKAVDDLLVGFKYIAEVMETLPEGETFLFGTEESHGYLAGDVARDKDAAVAALLLAECAAMLKARGRSVRDYLDDIYGEFGYFREIQRSATRTGAEGGREIQEIMNGLRSSPPTSLGGYTVHEVVDRQSGTARKVASGEERSIDGPRGNVLALSLSADGHSRVTARPSGTEPKIKYYVSITSADLPELEGDTLEKTKRLVDACADAVMDDILEAAESHVSRQRRA